MIPSLEGLPTKAKEAPSPHEVRLALLDTNPVFHSLGWHNKKAQQSFAIAMLKTNWKSSAISEKKQAKNF